MADVRARERASKVNSRREREDFYKELEREVGLEFIMLSV